MPRAAHPVRSCPRARARASLIRCGTPSPATCRHRASASRTAIESSSSPFTPDAMRSTAPLARRGAPGRTTRDLATAASSVRTTPYVVRSVGFTPNSSVPNSGSTASDTATPAAAPIATRRKSVSYNRPCELCPLRTEGDAKPDFSRALRHHECKERIQAKRCEQQPAHGKRTRYERRQPFLRQALGNRFLEHTDVSDDAGWDPCDESRSSRLRPSPPADRSVRTASARAEADYGCRRSSDVERRASILRQRCRRRR